MRLKHCRQFGKIASFILHLHRRESLKRKMDSVRKGNLHKQLILKIALEVKSGGLKVKVGDAKSTSNTHRVEAILPLKCQNKRVE